MTGLEQLRQLARGNVHAGYRWMALASDGGMICERCVRENYREMYRATRWPQRDPNATDWRCEAIINSGECEEDTHCDHCGRLYFEYS